MTPDTLPPDFDGCSRDCRKTGTHTRQWGRCGLAPEPAPPSNDDLRGQLIAAGLVSHSKTMDDGYRSVIIHSNEEAADRALAVFREWKVSIVRAETVRAEKAEQLNLKLIEQAKEQAATIERAVELRDKWLKWPKDDPHYGAGLMLARYLDLPMEASDG